ncbi:MAG: aquaglyceroporin AqpS [Candidatus Dormibacteraceae bacterium]
MKEIGIRRRAFAEFIGTAFLLAAVVGSGIAAQRLSPNDIGLELLENAVATAAVLVAIILALGPVSGAHLNPAVTAADLVFGGLSARAAGAYVAAQVAGGLVGTVVANLMFGLPVLELSTRMRFGAGLWLAEAVATFGLLLVIFGVARSRRSAAAPFAVGAYIGGAYFFTASTSFANPAVTIAREFSNTFAGIAPGSVLPFLIAQIAGAALAIGAIRVLYPNYSDANEVAIVPHPGGTDARRA